MSVVIAAEGIKAGEAIRLDDGMAYKVSGEPVRDGLDRAIDAVKNRDPADLFIPSHLEMPVRGLHGFTSFPGLTGADTPRADVPDRCRRIGMFGAYHTVWVDPDMDDGHVRAVVPRRERTVEVWSR